MEDLLNERERVGYEENKGWVYEWFLLTCYPPRSVRHIPHSHSHNTPATDSAAAGCRNRASGSASQATTSSAAARVDISHPRSLRGVSTSMMC